MKENKKVKSNEKYAPTISLLDDDGAPLEWEFKHITSRRNDELREKCTIDEPVKGKPNLTNSKFLTGLYLRRMIAESVAFPDLFDAELQDSYGVSTPEDLLVELVDDPGEYAKLETWVSQFQGFTQSMDDKVNEAKN